MNEKLTKEALQDLQYDAELKAKNQIKDLLRGIINQQNVIKNAMNQIALLKEQLKKVEIEDCNIDL